MELIDTLEISSALTHADKARQNVSRTLELKTRSRLGQFMTPAPVASFMASMFDKFPSSIRLLDAGSGMGALTAAFIQEACARDNKPKSIDVTAFEIDPLLRQHLATTLEWCATECSSAGISFSSRVISEDFICYAAEQAATLGVGFNQFDCAILNPPYVKINTKSKTRNALKVIGVETTNLYSAFVAVALNRLSDGGQLVAITPRSFCNGSYFEPFRRFILGHSALKKAHIYQSRKQAFKDDEVLQENIIYYLVKSEPQPLMVHISVSHGPQDQNRSILEVPFSEVVLTNDPHFFIRLPATEDELGLALKVRTLPCMLKDLGLTVSTGRVVDFRVPNYLRKEPGQGTVPLIYPCHFDNGFVSWPKSECKKHNALTFSAETASLLVPKGTYVLTKRFSSKEENRRIVAAIYDLDRVSAELVGFENHLNYFHLNGNGIPAQLARGLMLYLNSTAVDQYFRQFSGHTQVNATDLRNLHYPSKSQLNRIGSYFGESLPTQKLIDEIIEPLFE